MPIKLWSYGARSSTLKNVSSLLAEINQFCPHNVKLLLIFYFIWHLIGTGKGKLSEKAYLKHGKSTKQQGTEITTYEIKVHVEPEFGIPGAFLMTNQHRRKFFLESMTLEIQDKQIIHFDCRSWVYPIKKTKSERLFFSNAVSYKPNLFYICNL